MGRSLSCLPVRCNQTAEKALSRLLRVSRPENRLSESGNGSGKADEPSVCLGCRVLATLKLAGRRKVTRSVREDLCSHVLPRLRFGLLLVSHFLPVA